MGVITLGALDIASLITGVIIAKIGPKVVTAEEGTSLVEILKAKIAALKAKIAANVGNESAAAIAHANATIAYAEAVLAA